MTIMCLRVSYKKNFKKICKKFFFCILKVTEESSRIQSWIRSWVRIHTDPYQNVTDPQHCFREMEWQKDISVNTESEKKRGPQRPFCMNGLCMGAYSAAGSQECTRLKTKRVGGGGGRCCNKYRWLLLKMMGMEARNYVCRSYCRGQKNTH